MNRSLIGLATVILLAWAWFHVTAPVASAANPATATYLKLLKSGRVVGGNVSTVLELVCSKGDEDDLRTVYDLAIEGKILSADARLKALACLADAAENRKLKPSGDLNNVGALLKDGGSAESQLAAIRLASLWKVAAAGDELQRLAAGPQSSDPLRQAALDGLVTLGVKESRSAIERLADAPTPMSVRYRATAALARMDVDAAAGRAAAALAEATPRDNPAPLVEAFLSVQHGPDKLAAAIAARKPSKDVAKLALRAMYGFGRNDAALSNVLSAAAEIPLDPPKPKPEEIARLAAEAAKSGDPARGEAVFRRADVGCMRCHSVVGAGGQVGPELSPIGASSPADYIVESILDPSAKIKEQYLTKRIVTSDGFVLTGIVVERNDQRLRLKDATGKIVVVAKADIDSETDGKSLMPEGLTKFLTHEELVDLVRFVSELGKPGPFGPRKNRTIQRWRVAKSLAADIAADPEKLRTFIQEDHAEVWTPAYGQVNGLLPLAGLGDPGKVDVLLQGEIEVTESGPIGFRIQAPPGTLVWLDDSPQTQTIFTAGDLASGQRHKLTLRAPVGKPDAGTLVEVLTPEGSTGKFTVVGGQ